MLNFSHLLHLVSLSSLYFCHVYIHSFIITCHLVPNSLSYLCQFGFVVLVISFGKFFLVDFEVNMKGWKATLNAFILLWRFFFVCQSSFNHHFLFRLLRNLFFFSLFLNMVVSWKSWVLSFLLIFLLQFLLQFLSFISLLQSFLFLLLFF